MSPAPLATVAMSLVNDARTSPMLSSVFSMISASRWRTLSSTISRSSFVKRSSVSFKLPSPPYSVHVGLSHSKVYQIQVQRDDLEVGRPNTRVIRPLPKQAQFHAVGKRGERYL